MSDCGFYSDSLRMSLPSPSPARVTPARSFKSDPPGATACGSQTLLQLRTHRLSGNLEPRRESAGLFAQPEGKWEAVFPPPGEGNPGVYL